MHRTGYVKPLSGVDEMLAEQDTESVREQDRPFENFHGMNITSDQAMEDIRLGVREDLVHALGGKEAGGKILDYRINKELRSKVTREIGLERQNAGFLHGKWIAGKGFFKNVASVVSFNTLSRGDVGSRVAEEYGKGTTVEERKAFLAKKFWDGLTVSQRTLVSNDLTGRGVLIPMGPFAPGINAQIAQISAASPDQMENMRLVLAFLPQRALDPIYPTRKPAPTKSTLDRLIELRETEAGAREKMLGTTVYDATRLQKEVLDKHPDISAFLEKVLVENALYPIEKNAEAQALIADVEQRFAAKKRELSEADPTKKDENIVKETVAALLKELEGVQVLLPVSGEKQDESKGPSEEAKQLEAAQKLMNKILESQESLCDKYAEAEALGSELYENQRRLAGIAEPQPTGKGKETTDTGYGDTVRDIEVLLKNKNKLKVEIGNMERRFGQNTIELMGMFVEKYKIPDKNTTGAQDSYNELRDLNQILSTGDFRPSGEEELFGKMYSKDSQRASVEPSNLSRKIKNLTPSKVKDMEKQIKSKHAVEGKKRERVTCRQLLTLLKADDYVKAGATNKEIARRRAFQWTNVRIAKVGNMQVYRQANEEVAEYLGETVLGSKRLARLGKILKAKMTHGRVLEARDLIDQIAGFDKDFHMFRGLPKDATLSELRNLMEANGGIEDNKLFEYAEKLKQVFDSFEMLNGAGKVELLDGDALDLERLIENLFLIREEVRSRKFFEELRGEKGDPAAAMLKKIREDSEARHKDEIGLLETWTSKDAEWKQLFSTKFLKQKFLESLRLLRKQKKDKTITAEEFSDRLKKEGMVTAYDVLKYGLLADEAYELGKIISKWTGRKAGVGAGRLGRGANWIWQKGGKPLAKAVIVKPATWIGKGVAYPFKLAGRAGAGLWKVVTPKKAEA